MTWKGGGDWSPPHSPMALTMVALCSSAHDTNGFAPGTSCLVTSRGRWGRRWGQAVGAGGGAGGGVSVLVDHNVARRGCTDGWVTRGAPRRPIYTHTPPPATRPPAPPPISCNDPPLACRHGVGTPAEGEGCTSLPPLTTRSAPRTRLRRRVPGGDDLLCMLEAKGAVVPADVYGGWLPAPGMARADAAGRGLSRKPLRTCF